MSDSEDLFRKRLLRLGRWVDRTSRVWQKTLSQTEEQYVNLIRELEENKLAADQQIHLEEERLKGQIDQASKDYVKAKYLYEKDTSQTKVEVDRAERDMEKTKQHATAELARLNQEKLNNQISFERQKSALHELYQEKKRHLLVTREKLIRESTQSETTFKQYRERYERDLETLKQDGQRKIDLLKDQLKSKRDGWAIATETMKKEMEALHQQKDDIEKKLGLIHDEKDQELQNMHLQINVAKEQLELDKVTLVEKAEEDQRAYEKEIRELEDKINSADHELQNLILQKETEKKNTEDGYQSEETVLKETLKNEAEKRDFEQKLYAQEKSQKEREIIQFKDEYEKRKAQWDNQLKTLLMQKSLQDAEHNSERMRVDREARVVVRSLEAKRDELKQRLSELESRHEALKANSSRELELLKQRWHWRKDRLWQMWQGRLDVLKKERQSLADQLAHLQDSYLKQKGVLAEETERQTTHVEDLKQAIVQGEDQWSSERRQREIQLELEKTRIIAQIKECETLVTDWMEKQKLSHDEVTRRKGAFVDDIDFLDRYYKAQVDETDVFLSTFQKALEILKEELERFGMKQDAA